MRWWRGSQVERKVYDAVAETLAYLGVKVFFGLIGSGNFHVSNALCEWGAQFIPARHEGGAITMADAWARLTGLVGVCTVHQGPGLTNTMTGLTEAVKSRTPLLLLAADTAGAAVRSNFKIDQEGLVRSVGAIAERVHGPATVVEDTVRAWWRAQVERRPVVLMLPLDVQSAPFEGKVSIPPIAPIYPARPSGEAVTRTLYALEAAQRPLIIAGRGAVISGARDALEALGEQVGALMATSAAANGLFAGNPWYVGISGGFASPAAAELIASADLVLAFGASLNMWTTRHGKLINPGATVVQVDHEPQALGYHHRVDIAVLGDARQTALELLRELLGHDISRQGWRTDEVARKLAEGCWQRAPYEDRSSELQIDPRTLSRALDEMLPEEKVLVTDSGHFMGYPAMYIRVPDAQGFVFTQAYQSVGLGLATAIGAAIARPDRLTVAALGDGGALMGLSELETVARLGLHMLIVIYNDSAYGAEVHHFGPEGAPLDIVRFPDFDFAPLAEAVGIRGVTVRKLEDLETVGQWLEAEAEGAMLVDAKVVPDVVAEWLEEAFRGH